jgi:hypothetical protein
MITSNECIAWEGWWCIIRLHAIINCLFVFVRVPECLIRGLQWTNVAIAENTVQYTWILTKCKLLKPQAFRATGQRYRSCSIIDHFFPKNDIMFPWPGLPPFFAAGLFVDAAGAILGFFGAGSSSEKDSQAASSFVTDPKLARWST